MMNHSSLPHQASLESLDDSLIAMKQRLTWLMLFRVFLSVGIGLSFVFLQATSLRSLYPSDSLPTIISVFVGVYVCNLFYLFSLSRSSRYATLLAYAQLFTDCLGSALLIFLTGGMESPLIFLFALHVLMGAISLYRAGAWFVVILAMGAFSLLCAHEISLIDFDRGTAFRTLKYILINGLYQLGLLSFIAALTGYLSEQSRLAHLRLSFASADMKTLRRLNEHLLMSVHNGIIYLNHRGHILIVNQATERFLSLSAKELLQMKIQDIFPQLPSLILHESLESQLSEHFILSDTGVYSWEYLSLRSASSREPLAGDTLSNDRVILDCMLSEVIGSHQHSINSGWLIILQDVTMRRRLEAKMSKRERLASLGEVAAQIAHEVRNPLAAMVSSLELLRHRSESNISDDRSLDHRLINIVERETQRINTLIESFLNFSRPPKPHPTLFSLNRLITDLSLIKSQRVINRLQGEVEVFADADQVRQILWNLFNNAWEAESEEVEVSARLIQQTLGREEWEIMIEDQGIGFSDSLGDLEELFRPFYTEKESGTGIGLSLCRALTELQGGSLEAQRRKGGGAIFVLTLPMKESELEVITTMESTLTDNISNGRDR